MYPVALLTPVPCHRFQVTRDGEERLSALFETLSRELHNKYPTRRLVIRHDGSQEAEISAELLAGMFEVRRPRAFPLASAAPREISAVVRNNLTEVGSAIIFFCDPAMVRKLLEETCRQKVRRCPRAIKLNHGDGYAITENAFWALYLRREYSSGLLQSHVSQLE
jgi:hypothetical protein